MLENKNPSLGRQGAEKFRFVETNSTLSYPQDWQFTPVKGKRPYVEAWQNNPVPLAEIETAIANKSQLSGQIPTGLGVILGTLSNGLVAVDIDGISAHAYLSEKSLDLPKTVASTSGREGRACHFYQVHTDYWELIQTHNYKTGTDEATGKAENLDGMHISKYYRQVFTQRLINRTSGLIPLTIAM